MTGDKAKAMAEPTPPPVTPTPTPKDKKYFGGFTTMNTAVNGSMLGNTSGARSTFLS